MIKKIFVSDTFVIFNKTHFSNMLVTKTYDH